MQLVSRSSDHGSRRLLVTVIAASLSAFALAGSPGCPCVGDLNADGVVDGADLGTILAQWGPCVGCSGDLNGSGIVDGADLGILLSAWGPCDGPPLNDECVDAIQVVGFSGTANVFCTLNATSNGPVFTAPCGVPGFDGIFDDVWYTVVSPSTATLQISVCADFPVRLAVYGQNTAGNCGCVGGGSGQTLGPLLACGDTQSFPGCPQGAAVLVPAVAGQCFRVRIGGAAGSQGTGNLDINVYTPTCSVGTLATLPAAALEPGSSFGLRTAIDGNIGVASAILDDLLFTPNAGTVRVYQNDGVTWQTVTTLAPPAAFSFQRLGIDLGVSGQWIAASTGSVSAACFADPNCETGAVHLFYNFGGGWVHWQQLVSDGLSPADRHGSRLAIDGDHLLVGAWDDTNANGVRAGAVYAYRRPTTPLGNWQFEQKLLAGDGTTFDEFGSAIAIDGDTAIIGARKAGSSGAVYVFKYGDAGWNEIQKLQPADLPNNAWFGDAVAIEGNQILIGAPLPMTAPGAVHAYQDFVGHGWLRTKVLTADDAETNARFGARISIDGNFAVIGAPNHESAVGRAYVFQRFGGGWLQRSGLMPADPAAGSNFGSVALGGGRALIGAHGVGTGKVYTFKGIADCNANAQLDWCEIVAGLPDSNGDGVPDVCD